MGGKFLTDYMTLKSVNGPYTLLRLQHCSKVLQALRVSLPQLHSNDQAQCHGRGSVHTTRSALATRSKVVTDLFAPISGTVDSLKAQVATRVFDITGTVVYKSSFRLLQGGVHRLFATPIVKLSSASFTFEWTQQPAQQLHQR